jgi:hypothetical protein
MKSNYNGEASNYTYDDHSRSTKDRDRRQYQPPRTYTFSYDAAGNRLTEVVTGTTPYNQSLTYNSGNQISSSGYSYDGAGNRTAGAGITAAAYNTAGQLISDTKAGSPPATTTPAATTTSSSAKPSPAATRTPTPTVAPTRTGSRRSRQSPTPTTAASPTPTSPTTTPACPFCSPPRPAAPVTRTPVGR